MSIDQGVESVGLVPLLIRHGVGQPSVVGLAGDLQYPARHRHRDTIGGGEIAYERVEPFDGRFACDKYAAARRSTRFSCSKSRLRRRSSRSSSF